MISEQVALALIATTVVVLALLTVATVHYVPKMLPGGDHGEEHDHEGNEQSAGRPA